MRRISITSAILVAAVVAAFAGMGACGSGNSTTSSTTGTTPFGLSCTASAINGHAPLAVHFGAAVTNKDLNNLQFLWNFGDGTNGSTSDTTKTYTMGGVFSAVVTAVSGDTQATCTQTITVESDIRVDRCDADPSNGTTPLGVDFTATVNGSGTRTPSLTWFFGDGASAVADSPNHVFTTAGSYVVRVVAQAGASAAQCTTQVDVFNAMAATCDANPTSGTAPLSVDFTAGPAGCSYEWDFGDGSPVSGHRGVSHVYNWGGFYLPEVVVTCGLERGTCRQKLTIVGPARPVPVPSASGTP